MKLKRLTPDRATEITEQTEGQVVFKHIDGTIKGITFRSSVGFLYVDIDSYSVAVCEQDTKDVFHLGFFASVADEKLRW